MAENIKGKQDMLNKLGIEQLNPMQYQAHEAILHHSEVILLSPTGTGKTLAFLLPIIEKLDPNIKQVQVLILVPSRELAIQIEQVVRNLGSGYKTNAVYGGRHVSKDKIELKHPPAILIGTPGRIADHMRRQTVDSSHIKVLVLDEFDKSLEVGFELEMIEIIDALPKIEQKVLTSATQKVEIPSFIGIKQAKKLNFIHENNDLLQLKMIVAEGGDKLETLVKLIHHVGNASGIIFCNLKDTISLVSDYLYKHNLRHACFFGGLEQVDRERALIKFRNGTHRLLVATDLAARGIDVPEMDFIIHFEIPPKVEEFTHRNGRTARMHTHGTAYVIRGNRERVPHFVEDIEELSLKEKKSAVPLKWETLFITGGRKDKISKGDIAGLLIKKGNLEAYEVGIIELKQDYAFVAVPIQKAKQLVASLNNSKLKNKKVRISVLEN